MKDIGLVCLGVLIVISYITYMTVGPGGDGVIFASVVGAVMTLGGMKYERNKIRGSN